MAKWHLRSHRKPTGAKMGRLGKKKKNDAGSAFVETQIGERKAKAEKTYGGNIKIRLARIGMASISDKEGKAHKTKILSVAENPANQHYTRRNIITKGAIIKTELGLSRVTSRPGQDGIVNAVLVEKKATNL